jgi:hypothetical protein
MQWCAQYEMITGEVRTAVMNSMKDISAGIWTSSRENMESLGRDSEKALSGLLSAAAEVKTYSSMSLSDCVCVGGLSFCKGRRTVLRVG